MTNEEDGSTPAKASARRRRPARRASAAAPAADARAHAAAKKAGAEGLLRAGLKALGNVRDDVVKRQTHVIESLLGVKVNDAAAGFGFKKFEDVFDQRVATALAAPGLCPSAKEIAALRDEVRQLRERTGCAAGRQATGKAQPQALRPWSQRDQRRSNRLNVASASSTTATTTRDRILQTSLQLFNGDGLPSVSTHRIAAELGMSPGNLHYHFKTKQLIVERLFRRFEERLLLHRPAVGVDRAIDDLWLALHLRFEAINDYRFVYRDMAFLASEYPDARSRARRR